MAFAGPDAEVAEPLQPDAARGEAVVQSLVDVDRARVDRVGIAGVDLRPGADPAEAEIDDRDIGEPGLDRRKVGGKEPALGDGNEAARAKRFGLTSVVAEIDAASRKLRGEQREEVGADHAELPRRGLDRLVVTRETESALFETRERDRRRFVRSRRSGECVRRQRASGCSVVEEELPGNALCAQRNIGGDAVPDAADFVPLPAAKRLTGMVPGLHEDGQSKGAGKAGAGRDREKSFSDERHALRLGRDGRACQWQGFRSRG